MQRRAQYEGSRCRDGGISGMRQRKGNKSRERDGRQRGPAGHKAIAGEVSDELLFSSVAQSRRGSEGDAMWRARLLVEKKRIPGVVNVGYGRAIVCWKRFGGREGRRGGKSSGRGRVESCTERREAWAAWARQNPRLGGREGGRDNSGWVGSHGGAGGIEVERYR
jgi:hypothetical protein